MPLKELVESLSPERRARWERLWRTDHHWQHIQPLVYPHPVTKQPVSVALFPSWVLYSKYFSDRHWQHVQPLVYPHPVTTQPVSVALFPTWVLYSKYSSDCHWQHIQLLVYHPHPVTKQPVSVALFPSWVLYSKYYSDRHWQHVQLLIYHPHSVNKQPVSVALFPSWVLYSKYYSDRHWQHVQLLVYPHPVSKQPVTMIPSCTVLLWSSLATHAALGLPSPCHQTACNYDSIVYSIIVIITGNTCSPWSTLTLSPNSL